MRRRNPAEQLDAAEAEIVEVVVGAEVLVETRAAVAGVADKLAEEVLGDLALVTAEALALVLAPQAQGLDLAVDQAAVGTVEAAAENTSSPGGEWREE